MGAHLQTRAVQHDGCQALGGSAFGAAEGRASVCAAGMPHGASKRSPGLDRAQAGLLLLLTRLSLALDRRRRCDRGGHACTCRGGVCAGAWVLGSASACGWGRRATGDRARGGRRGGRDSGDDRARRCGGGGAAWSKCSLGSAPARLLCLRRARLAAPGSSALPGRGRPTGFPAPRRPATVCSSEPPPKLSRIHCV